MADFVAVIRRAVDGLSDNNAEMRQKVYEKARGAVRRQLESMNPRPSNELMKRQLDKLEAAIESVEGDHAEALPLEDVAPEPAEETLQDEPVAEEPAAVAEPEQEPVQEDAEPAQEEVEPEPELHEEPVSEPAEATSEDDPVVGEEQAVQAEEPAIEEPVADQLVVDQPVHEPDPEPVAETVAEEEPVAEEQVPAEIEAHAGPSWHVEAEPADDYVPSWQEAQPDTLDAREPETAETFEPEQQVFPVHDEQVPEAEPLADARMPATEAQWEWHEPAPIAEAPSETRTDDIATETDPLAWEWPDEKVAEPEAKQEKSEPANEWGDLDALIGHSHKAEAGVAASAAANDDFGAATNGEAATRQPQRSFRAEPRKSRASLGSIAAIVGFLAVVGGAGAGYWFNRDAVNDWVNDLVASSTETPADTSQPSDTAEGGRDLPANGTAAGTSQDGNGGNTEVAAANPSSDGKFTQRLLTDGSEVDEGPAPALDGGTTEEGKSVAAQTSDGAGVATDGGGDAAAAGTDGAAQTPATGTETATGTDTQTPAATGEQAAAVGATQKMFLYEERLGQTSPTAIEGTVAWSSAEESPGGDAKPEPVVRAQISVPSKGLTALVTFRRNADKSLPASHIVELVFSLPESFEGGGIESVQRVAMKRTEQDRGDALIAVPAKITDDFHMIALNDFPEAIAKNTELLRSRGWIDIPITYRNGRRALLTLEKGTTGTAAFDTVMKAWGSAGGNSQ